jgi:hypothetical protein
MLTSNGRIEMRRQRWHAVGEGSDTPVDRLVDWAESAVSVGVREMCCRLGIAGGSFQRSATNLQRAAQVQISEEYYRQIVESDGQAVLAAQDGDQLELDWSAAECKTKTPQGQEVSRIYLSADGVMAPVTTRAEKLKRRATVMKRRREKRAVRGKRRPRLAAVKGGADQRYKQFNLVAFYDQDQEHRLVSVTRNDHRSSGKLMRRDAARLRIRAADERVAVIDGAPCLRNQIERQRLPMTAVGLDFYHLAEHVHKGRRETFGEQDEGGRTWASELLHTVRHEGYERCWEKLTPWRGRQRSPAKRHSADELLHYVAERKEMIRYDEFEQHGWHIGSGPIEAMCKATTRRIKGPGMRWNRDNAEALMALEALHQSNQWDQYWAKAACQPT